jgi:uncharacterized membrane protein YkvA (DUF1232 family)
MSLWLWALSSVVALFVLLALGGWWLMRNLSADSRALVRRIGRLSWRAKGRLALALTRDARVPLWLRALIPALFLYLAMPIDIIPDFIPVLGHLDDLLVVVLAVGALVRFTPRTVLEDHLALLEAPTPSSLTLDP